MIDRQQRQLQAQPPLDSSNSNSGGSGGGGGGGGGDDSDGGQVGGDDYDYDYDYDLVPARIAADRGLMDSLISRCREVRWPDSTETPAERIATEFGLPPWLAEALVRRHGFDGASAMATVLNLPGPVAIRRNALRAPSLEALARRLEAESGVRTSAGRCSHLSALVLTMILEEKPRSIWGLPSWQEGWFEVQDEGSQVRCMVEEFSRSRGGRGEEEEGKREVYSTSILRVHLTETRDQVTNAYSHRRSPSYYRTTDYRLPTDPHLYF